MNLHTHIHYYALEEEAAVAGGALAWQGGALAWQESVLAMARKEWE